MVAFIAAHIPLALAMQRIPILAKVHSLVVLGFGLWYGSKRGGEFKVARLAAYLVGSEVLWRMCGGGFFWEFGKYGFVAVVGAMLLRSGGTAWDPMAMSYCLLLLPATAFTLLGAGWVTARNDISFYLSGPLALAIGVSFFLRLRLSLPKLGSLLLAAMAPILGVAALCYGSTFASDDVDFGSGSNASASGGFGPNQVSAALGFGIVLAVLCLWLTPNGKLFRLMLIGSVMFFVTQVFLTLSRTGLWLAAFSCFCGGFLLARGQKQQLQLILSAMAIGLLTWLVVFPMVDEFSGGAVSKRFQKNRWHRP